MSTQDAHCRSAQPRPDLSALREIVRQSELSGARRCAAVLFMDQLPDALAKPHHMRLFRQALQNLLCADRAQTFELPRNRLVVVWRGSDAVALETARQELDHLLSGHPETVMRGSSELLRAYDLPQQAECLLDDLAEQAAVDYSRILVRMDLKLLAELEAALASADLARFARVRPVMTLINARGSGVEAKLAWEQRFLAIGELAASLAPGRDLQSDPWLFGRLTRTLDVRKLTLLSAAGELARCGPFAIDINIATILSPAFLRFDSVLPGHLRGDVILTLRAADILSGSVDFAFARNFARSRLYRLALADVTPRLLGLLDVAAAGIDLLHIPLTPALREADPAWRRLVAPGSSLVLTGISRPSELRWAIAHGFHLGSGALLNQ